MSTDANAVTTTGVTDVEGIDDDDDGTDDEEDNRESNTKPLLFPNRRWCCSSLLLLLPPPPPPPEPAAVFTFMASMRGGGRVVGSCGGDGGKEVVAVVAGRSGYPSIPRPVLVGVTKVKEKKMVSKCDVEQKCKRPLDFLVENRMKIYGSLIAKQPTLPHFFVTFKATLQPAPAEKKKNAPSSIR